MPNTDNLSFNFNNQHYYQVTDTNYQSWADAVNNASELGGYLVSIDDETESSLLQQSLNSEGKYWVGGEEGNVFGGAVGESFIAAPDDNLSLPGIIEYDSAFDYYTSADYLDSAISTLLPDSLSYLWNTVSIEQPADNQYELSWQDEINLTELFDVDNFLPDVNIASPTFSITTGDSGSSYGFAGDITVAGQEFDIDASFTLEDIGGISSFNWDNIAFPQVSLGNLTSLLGDAVSGLDNFFDSETEIKINISDTGAELAWDGNVNLTSLFGLGGSFPDLIVATPTFAIATEDDSTTYEFAGNVNVAGTTAGFSSSFIQEEADDGSSEFSWQEIAINELSLNSVTNLLGDSISGFDSFFGNTSTTIDININPNSTELSWNNQINLTSLFGLDGLLPELSIDTPTLAIATEDDSTTYNVAGDVDVAGTIFTVDASFTSEDIEGVRNFNWDNIAFPQVSLGNLTSLLGDAVSGLDNFFGSDTEIDINISDTGAELAWNEDNEDINLTSLFGLGSSFPDLIVATPTFAIATEDDSTTYEFAGNVNVAGTTAGFSSSFIQEEADDGSSEFSWQEIAINELSLNSVTNLLGDSISGFDSFFGNTSTTIDININPNSTELSWNNQINLTSLFGLDGLLPELSIDTPTLAIATEDDSTTYNVAGDVDVAGTIFTVDASFTSEDIEGVRNFNWDNIAFPQVSLGNLTSLLGDAVSGLDNFFDSETEIKINISDTGAELAWDGNVNLTSLFGLGSSFPDLIVATPTFAIATEDDSTTYEFAGDIKLASGDVGLSSSFVQQDVNGSSEFSWSEIEISEFDLDNITDLLGNSFSAVDNFLDNNLPNLPKITVGITEDEIELTLAEDIDVSKLLKLNSFLPGLDLSIANPSFAIATENNTNTYKLAGDFSVLGETFNLSTSFTESTGGGLDFQELSIPDFSIGTLAGMMGGAFTQVDDVFGDALPEIDVTITKSELAFGSAINFASSSNKSLQWIHKNLDIDTLDVDFIYNTSGAISLDAGVTGEFELVSTKDLDATLTNVGLSFDVDYSGSTWETALALEAGARLDIKDSDNTSLDLSGAISFAAGSGGFEAEGYFALDAGQAGWDNPFGLPDSSIRSFGLGLGIVGVTGLDSFGIRGDLQFGNYDFDAAFSVDLTNPDEFALAATLNTPISVLDLLAGPAASYALGQAANNVGFIDDAKDIMNEVLDVNVVSIDSDGDEELDPLIYIVPQDTEIAGKLYEQGFSINAAVSAWGKDASLYFNSNAETGEISGGLNIDKINIDVNDTTILKIEGSDFADDNGKGTIVGGTVTEADKYIDQSNHGTLVRDATISGEGNDGTLVGNATVSEEANHGTLIDGTIADGTLKLDGVNDYVKVASASELSLTDGTIEFRVTPDWAPGEKNYNPAVLANRDTTGTNYSIHMRRNLDGIDLWNGSQVGTVAYNFQQGVEYHVALVESGTTTEVFINGVSQGIMNRGFSGRQGLDFHIGSSNGTREFFEGTIDDVRVWNTVRSAAEISDNYQNSLTGEEAGLVAYWNFEEESVGGNTVQDITAGGVLNLDGSGDYVAVGNESNFDFGEGSFTVEAWVYDDPSSPIDYHNAVSKKSHVGAANGWTLRLNPGNKPEFFLGDGTTRVDVTHTEAIAPGEWYHLAGVVDRETNQAQLYVNGILVATQSIANLGSFDSDVDLRFGRWELNTDYWKGQIDDVRIWNQARSSAEISDNYQNSLSGEEVGLVGYWNFEEESVEDNVIKDVTADGVLNLDGSGDYVNVASDRLFNLSDNSAFTLEAWINPDHDDNAYHGFIGSQGSNATQRTPGMWIVGQTGIHFGFGDGSSWNHQTANNVLTSDSWNHVATTFDGITYTLYVNGEAVRSTNAFAGKTPYASDSLTIGKVAGSHFQGEMDEVRVWDIARSAAEIGDNYQNSLTGEEAGLVAYWNFENGSVEGNTVKDVAKNDVEFVNSTSDGVLQLDGTDDYVNVSSDRTLDLSINKTFTLEAWINPDHDDNGYHGFIGSQGNNINQRTPGMWVVNQTGITFGFGDGSSWNHQTANNVLTPDSWNHVATTFDGKTYTLYVNGENVYSTDAFAGKTPYGSDSLTIGKVAGSHFEGEMDEVRVWNIARSASQIEAYFQQPLTGEERGLVGYWNFDSDLVNGNTVKDLAAGDDNLNLDFKLSDIDSYLRGDGKITFLGESIDVYVEAGSSGLEFAMATDNGTLTTDLAIILDKSGFAASGGVDLDISAHINLPFGLGKISLVNLEVNTDASISVDESGFASSFDGSVTVNGKSISFSIDIDVAFSNVEDLYNQLKAEIVQEIKDSAKDVFSDVTEWANAIANGTVQFAGDVANVASNAYNATEDAFVEVAQTIGQTAEDITNGLSNTYNATKNDIAGFLNDAGYTSSAITDALVSELNATATDVAQALNSIGTSSTAIANTLVSKFNSTATGVTQALNSIGTSASDVATILKNKFSLSGSQMTSTLESAFNVGGSAMAKILKDNGFGIDTVLSSVKNFYNLTATPSAQALNFAGYTIDEMANAINFGSYWTAVGFKNVGFNADQITNAFNKAGRGIDFITDGLKRVYNLNPDSIASKLFNVGYNAKDVGNVLEDAFDLTKSPIADALKKAGYGIDDTGKALKSLGYSKSAVKDALKGAGFSGVNDWANKFWDKLKFW